MENLELLKKYLPYIYFDKKEPFYPRSVGCTIFTETAKSQSFNRIIEVNSGTSFVVEYAIYWNFDIGHLYELEHIWVYVDEAGKIVNVEASFHGMYFRNLLHDRSNIEDETHVVLYSQPGKHALMPRAENFYLLPDLFKVTDELVGIDGLSLPEMFVGKYETNEGINLMVRDYMKKFKFKPTMEFEKYVIGEELLTTWDDLYDNIPKYIKEVLAEIENELIHI